MEFKEVEQTQSRKLIQTFTFRCLICDTEALMTNFLETMRWGKQSYLKQNSIPDKEHLNTKGKTPKI